MFNVYIIYIIIIRVNRISQVDNILEKGIHFENNILILLVKIIYVLAFS